MRKYIIILALIADICCLSVAIFEYNFLAVAGWLLAFLLQISILIGRVLKEED